MEKARRRLTEKSEIVRKPFQFDQGKVRTLLSHDATSAVQDSLVGLGEATRLDHLRLVLDEQLDTLKMVRKLFIK